MRYAARNTSVQPFGRLKMEDHIESYVNTLITAEIDYFARVPNLL